MKIEFGPRSQAWLHRTGRLILGSVFICAAVFKIEAPEDFADSIAAYQIVPVSAINVLALGLPLFELICGIFVLTGILPRVGLLGVIAMLAVFTPAFATARLRGLSIDCGCFPGQSWFDSNPWAALFRDGILLVLAIATYQHSSEKFQLLRGQPSDRTGPVKIS